MKTIGGIEFSVVRRGTEDCLVRFRMKREDMEKVRKYFGAGQHKLFWAQAEVASQGNGWYEIFSCNGVVDGALKGLWHIETALKLGQKPKLEEKVCRPERYYVVKGTKRERKAVSRAAQCSLHMTASIAAAFAELFSATQQIVSIHASAEAVQAAQERCENAVDFSVLSQKFRISERRKTG